ncbi:MAG: polysaccharide export protein [Muribaculaceae bacterium]|nr:polysaccharide export protein [Muribaculaceae bacterium]
MKITKLLAGIAISAMMLSSCSTPKNITYLQDLNDKETVQAANPIKITVKPEDKLYILVSTQKEELDNLFNLHSTQSTGQNRPSYTVNANGDINFPMLGEIHVGGMTRFEVSEYITRELMEKNLVKDPVVIVEFENTGVYIGGEVNNPGKYDINLDRLTIVQALMMAGDLTIQGKRENILVLRNEGDKQVAYRLDLTNAEQLFNSPAYYLQQNDVVLVEPNNTRKRQTTSNGSTPLTASFWLSVASFATTIAVLIFK